MKIAVCGLGNWGTALTLHLGRLGHQITAWSRDAAVVQSINTERFNPDYLSEFSFPATVLATQRISDLSSADLLIYSLPSSSLASVLPELKLKPGAIFLSAVKGLESATLTTPLQFARAHFKKSLKYAVISGPGFAREISRGLPAGLVCASEDEAVARTVAELFAGGTLRLYLAEDTDGVELGGILKNVIALGVGICDGLQFGDSARAGLITRGIAEMMRFAEAFGGKRDTLAGLSGLGDLVLTATSDTSRNRTVGLRLAQGESLENIINTLGSTAEGVTTAPLVLAMAAKKNIDMPISAAVQAVLSGQSSARDMAKLLLERPLKKEF